MENVSQHQLTEFAINLQQAGTGKRFANYIVDLLVFYAAIFFFGMFLAFLDPRAGSDVETASAMGSLLERWTRTISSICISTMGPTLARSTENSPISFSRKFRCSRPQPSREENDAWRIASPAINLVRNKCVRWSLPGKP